jgi:tetratricopeptide (TPR) repeat protein
MTAPPRRRRVEERGAMRCAPTALLVVSTLLVACAGNPDRHTLSELHGVAPDMADVQVENGLDQAMLAYRSFLEEAPESALTPEAMRRLADLKLEKQYGILGDGEPALLPAPEKTPAPAAVRTQPGERPRAASIADHSESEQEFERRASSNDGPMPVGESPELELPGGEQVRSAGPLEAIELYDQILAAYPNYPHNDKVLYQKARAYDELGRTEEAIAVIEQLVAEYPHSRYVDEVQFRRAEHFFVRKKYFEAESAYAAITAMGPASEYYELALYKLGWTFYKQELHEEALQQYVALLDYKVSIGYDFDQSHDEADQQRIADTYRVISLSFSSLGGPEAVVEYFAAHGSRSYEDRIYSHLGEFYLEKLRYNDAAAVYKTFVGLYPLHRSAPHFSMRVVEIYEAGDFPKLVLESKKEFAATYGLQSEYWRHFDPNDSPEVLSYLKSNLKDLANHYHALYQEPELANERLANFSESSRWYRAYLASFPQGPETPGINHQLADLLLENRDFGEAAREYERTAYDYPEHEAAATAAYAAIYAHRENQEVATGEEQELAKREAVGSTLRFADRFPKHEHVPAVLGAAVDDLYEMSELDLAIATGRRLIDDYPDADLPIRRAAWAVIAHSSFDLGDYPQAEEAYGHALEMTPEDDDARPGFVDNLAAAIYKQGEQASLEEDHRAAADHFLRIAKAAPSSKIRPMAEYDAGAALIRLEDWTGAAAVLESFRQSHPDHELHGEATKQMAFVYREEGNLSRAAEEYARVATESADPEVRREALLVAGELHEESQDADRALAAYRSYVDQFPEPLESAVETRFKIATIYRQMGDEPARHEQLRRIVELDARAGQARSERIRYLAAQSALVLSEDLYRQFAEVELVQPFEKNLQEKQRRMSAALEGFGRLVEYEIGEVTAAATFYMAEVYSDFSRSLIESERPAGLDPGEMQDYEMVLEEEAFPFEERAIAVHEKNLELMAAGLFNPWIEKSLGRLGELMPGRYAKFEQSSGLIAAIDRYAYRAPNSPAATGEEGARGDPTESDAPASPAGPDPEPVPASGDPAWEAVETG